MRSISLFLSLRKRYGEEKIYEVHDNPIMRLNEDQNTFLNFCYFKLF